MRQDLPSLGRGDDGQGARKICVIGCGYVGLVTAAGFASLGHTVFGIEQDGARLAALRSGRVPFYEPGLEQQVRENLARGRLTFSDEYREGVQDAGLVFLAVNTPAGEGGSVDLTNFWQAADELVRACEDHRPIVIVKSTVPVGTTQALADFLRGPAGGGRGWPVVASPEFLSEGDALRAFRESHRIVIGSDDPDALAETASLYAVLAIPIVATDFATAELIKYGSNAFLATKISFVNELAHLCEGAGADVRMVAQGMGLDPRIAPSFLRAGVGFGGSCLPKDARALARMARQAGAQLSLLEAALEVNRRQRQAVALRLREALGSLRGRRVALWGLAFKPNTDDVREAPAADVIEALLMGGAQVRAYDPMANDAMRQRYPEVLYAPDPLAAAEGADALVLLTEWEEFLAVDWAELRHRMRGNVLLDGRYAWERGAVECAGLRYLTLSGGPRYEARRPALSPAPTMNGRLVTADE